MNTQALKNISLRISSGGTPSRRRSEYFSIESGHLWVKSKELLDSGISNTEEKITDNALNDSSAKYFPEQSVLIAMYGANVGQLGWLKKPATVNQAVCGLVIDPEKADWRYVFYALLQNRDNLTVQARGAAQQNLNQDLIKEFKIPLLPLEDQRSVSDILSIYDDLIYNNTRRIQILEQIVQAIYTEWFVNFRFPGHEKVKMIDSGTEFGKIPKGWKISKMGSILNIKSGYAFKSKGYTVEGLYKIVTIKNIHDGKFVSDFNYILEIPKNMPDHCRLSDGDILLSLTGNVGRACLVYGENFLLNQRVGKIDPKNILYKSFIYSLFRSGNFKKKLEMLSNGVAQQNLSPVQTLDLKIVLPSISLITDYDNLVSRLVKLTVNLNKLNDSLSKSRDLLLLKLVTGEIIIR